VINSILEKENSQVDGALWASIKAGDKKAFEIIYQRYVRQLYVEISKRIADMTVVDDLVQDIFLSLWANKESYNPKGPIYPYLYGMAINRVLNYYRTHKMQPAFIQIWENLPEEIVGLEELSAAFKVAYNEEMESLLDQAITALPPRLRQVYQLRFEEKKSVNEIAAYLSISPNTIYNQLKVIKSRFVEAIKHSSYFFL